MYVCACMCVCVCVCACVCVCMCVCVYIYAGRMKELKKEHKEFSQWCHIRKAHLKDVGQAIERHELYIKLLKGDFLQGSHTQHIHIHTHTHTHTHIHIHISLHIVTSVSPLSLIVLLLSLSLSLSLSVSLLFTCVCVCVCVCVWCAHRSQKVSKERSNSCGIAYNRSFATA